MDFRTSRKKTELSGLKNMMTKLTIDGAWAPENNTNSDSDEIKVAKLEAAGGNEL